MRSEDTNISKIIPEFVKVLKEFAEKGLITREMIVNCKKANEGNLHNKLQGVFIKAVNNCGYLAIPEEKIQLEKPILRRKKYQKVYKPDVSFYKNDERIGICEIISMETVAQLFPTEELEKICTKAKVYWKTSITSATKLLTVPQQIKNSKIFIIVVMPKIAKKTPAWKDFKAVAGNSNHIFEKFKPALDKLCEKLKENCSVYPLVITEDEPVKF
ncbi:MAG: hypothetical protein QXS68_05540 [Candidatus Methanomethylicaceae archaeon]